MRDTLEPFRQYLADRRSPRTVRTYVKIAEAFVAFVGDTTTSPGADHVAAFLGRLRKNGLRPAAATRNQELAALRVFFAYLKLRDPGLIDPTEGLTFLREPPREATVLTLAETRRLFEVAATTSSPWTRARNLAVLALLAQAGLRVHELVGLDVDQVDLGSATLLAVRGKGGSIHNVPMNVPAVVLVTAWLAMRAGLPAPTEPALFLSKRGTRLGIRAVQLLLVRLRERLGTRKKLTPHTLRHTTATLALSLGADLSTVADLLRHADVNVTRKYYLHLVDERRREAVERLALAVPPGILRALPGAGSGAVGALGAPEARARAAGPDVPHAGPDIDRPTSSINGDADLDAQLSLGDLRHRERERPLPSLPTWNAPPKRLAPSGQDGQRRRPVCASIFGTCMDLGLTCTVAGATSAVCNRTPTP